MGEKANVIGSRKNLRGLGVVKDTIVRVLLIKVKV
jgi:hypothetical protein